MTIGQFSLSWEWPLSRKESARHTLGKLVQLYEDELSVAWDLVDSTHKTLARSSVFAEKIGSRALSQGGKSFQSVSAESTSATSQCQGIQSSESTPEQDWNWEKLKCAMQVFTSTPPAATILEGMPLCLQGVAEEHDGTCDKKLFSEDAGRERAISMWQHSLESLVPSCDEESNLLIELRSLCLPGSMEIQPKCHLQTMGDNPILVTAPHSMSVLRSEQGSQSCEIHTDKIAKHMAGTLCGTALQWTESQRRSSEILWRLSNDPSSSNSSLLDPRILDPNCLGEKDLALSEWHSKMRQISSEWKDKFDGRAMLHINLHGCEDPPAAPSHLTVGLGAMLQRSEQQSDPLLAQRVKLFGEALEGELPHVLATLLIKIKKDGNEGERRLLSVVYTKEADKPHEGFSGTWPVSSGYHSQCQQALLHAGFMYSLQLDMSLILRNRLAEDANATARLCTALKAAWMRVSSSSNVLPQMQPRRLSRKSGVRLSAAQRQSGRLSRNSLRRGWS